MEPRGTMGHVFREILTLRINFLLDIYYLFQLILFCAPTCPCTEEFDTGIAMYEKSEV